jgi:hypothetical protein
MEEKQKIQYEPPVAEGVEVGTEGIVCLSGELNGFGEEIPW